MWTATGDRSGESREMDGRVTEHRRGSEESGGNVKIRDLSSASVSVEKTIYVEIRRKRHG